MRALWITLIPLIGLSACINLGPSQMPKTYDLSGVYAYKEVKRFSNTAFFLNQITADDAVNSISILYRLMYQDPNQIMAYSESHWRILPVELVSARFFQVSPIPVRNRSVLSGAGNCAIDISLVAFEQRFTSPEKGEGIVDWKVFVTDVNNRRFVDEKRFTYKVPMKEANASSGVLALAQGVDMAILDTLNWLSSEVLMHYPGCAESV